MGQGWEHCSNSRGWNINPLRKNHRVNDIEIVLIMQKLWIFWMLIFQNLIQTIPKLRIYLLI